MAIPSKPSRVSEPAAESAWSALEIAKQQMDEARAQLDRINKIPSRRPGGGKNAKKDASQAFETARNIYDGLLLAAADEDPSGDSNMIKTPGDGIQSSEELPPDTETVRGSEDDMDLSGNANGEAPTPLAVTDTGAMQYSENMTGGEKPSSKGEISATEKREPAGKKVPGTVTRPKEKGSNQPVPHVPRNGDDSPALHPNVDFKNVEDGLAGLIPFEDDGDGNSGDKMDLRGKPVNADMGVKNAVNPVARGDKKGKQKAGANNDGEGTENISAGHSHEASDIDANTDTQNGKKADGDSGASKRKLIDINDGVKKKRKRRNDSNKEGVAVEEVAVEEGIVGAEVPSIKFCDMKPEDQQATQEEGQRAIRNYLTKLKPIPWKTRRLIRENQELFPETATWSKQLALHIFLTARKNYICRYHQKHRSHDQYDGYAGTYIVKGTAYLKKVSKSNNHTDPKEGHMHCGCAIDDVLMEFFFWKTWTAKSTRPGLNVSESLKDEVVPARLRAFINQAFKKTMCLTLDDLYGEDYGTQQYEARIRLKQAARMLQIVNKSEEGSLDTRESRWGIVRSEVGAGYLAQMTN